MIPEVGAINHWLKYVQRHQKEGVDTPSNLNVLP